MATASELLAACNSALLEIMSGAAQEKTIDLGGGNSAKYSALNIDQLRRFRDGLKAEVQAETAGSPFVSAQFLASGTFS